MKIQTVTHKTARRDGKPVKTFKLRYEETVRDPATGAPARKRSRSETYPTYDAADARRREIVNQRAATGTVVGREARLPPLARDREVVLIDPRRAEVSVERGPQPGDVERGRVRRRAAGRTRSVTSLHAL